MVVYMTLGNKLVPVASITVSFQALFQVHRSQMRFLKARFAASWLAGPVGARQWSGDLAFSGYVELAEVDVLPWPSFKCSSFSHTTCKPECAHPLPRKL